ncbi:hypothetical protein JTB14_015087 [Gonioctena quinquepunctata]|nr:hypothetical protein JTB14_015087 [Gonioctena quinquepunctata]
MRKSVIAECLRTKGRILGLLRETYYSGKSRDYRFEPKNNRVSGPRQIPPDEKLVATQRSELTARINLSKVSRKAWSVLLREGDNTNPLDQYIY